MIGAAVFLVTYGLISARRLSWLAFDRPAGALLGAVACVVLGVLGPKEALGAIDAPTLLLLFGVMGMGTFLAVDDFFEGLEARIVSVARTPARLLGLLVWSSGLLSALITNDAVCVLGAPLVVRLIQRQRLPALPFLLALATGANTGSVATLVGNPQNMLCGMLGGLEYGAHLQLVGPVALLGLAVNQGLLWLFFRRELAAVALTPPTEAHRPVSAPSWMTLSVILGTAVVYSLGGDLAWSAVAGFVLLMLLHRRDTRAAVAAHRLVAAALLRRALRGGRGADAERPPGAGLRALPAERPGRTGRWPRCGWPASSWSGATSSPTCPSSWWSASSSRRSRIRSSAGSCWPWPRPSPAT